MGSVSELAVCGTKAPRSTYIEDRLQTCICSFVSQMAAAVELFNSETYKTRRPLLETLQKAGDDRCTVCPAHCVMGN